MHKFCNQLFIFRALCKKKPRELGLYMHNERRGQKDRPIINHVAQNNLFIYSDVSFVFQNAHAVLYNTTNAKSHHYEFFGVEIIAQ